MELGDVGWGGRLGVGWRVGQGFIVIGVGVGRREVMLFCFDVFIVDFLVFEMIIEFVILHLLISKRQQKQKIQQQEISNF